MVQPLGKAVWKFLQKTKYGIPIPLSNYTPMRLSQRNEKLCSHQILYTNVYSSFVHNSCKLETTHMSFSRQLVKQTVVQPDHGRLLSNEKECIIEGSMRASCGDGNVLYIDWINANILTVMLWFSFAKYFNWEELGKEYIGTLCTISHNCMWIYDDLKIKLI